MPTLRASRWPAVLGLLAFVVGLAFVVTGQNWVTRADLDVVRTLAAARGSALADIAQAISLLGNFLVLTVLTLAVGAALQMGGAPTRRAFLPAASLAVAAALDPLLKLLIGRPRPPADLAAVIEQATGYPSGHSAQSAATWLVLAIVVGAGAERRTALLGSAVGIVGLVGASRVVLGVHSPTDVLGGWAFGVACALATIEVVTRNRPALLGGGASEAAHRPGPQNETSPA